MAYGATGRDLGSPNQLAAQPQLPRRLPKRRVAGEGPGMECLRAGNLAGRIGWTRAAAVPK